MGAVFEMVVELFCVALCNREGGKEMCNVNLAFLTGCVGENRERRGKVEGVWGGRESGKGGGIGEFGVG